MASKEIFYITKSFLLYTIKQVDLRISEFGLEIGNPILNQPDRLEASLNQPAMTISGKDAYPTLYLKAACLFYMVIKNHAFMDGNKRAAFYSLINFLNFNLIDLDTPPLALYHLAQNVAISQENQTSQIRKIARLIKKYAKSIEGGRRDMIIQVRRAFLLPHH